tara:strand:- start:243 stop:836 length:594 start_codon:yes stop_codon:yes gene_type:complete
MFDSYKNKQYLRVKAEIRSIKKDIQEVSETYRITQDFFVKSVGEYAENNNLKNPLISSSENKDDKDELGADLKGDFKKLFRNKGARLKKLWSKVMLQTHPDKNSFEETSVREEREELYKDSIEAQENGDIFAIIEAAKRLNIDGPEVSFEDLKILEKQLIKVQSDLDKIYNSYPWVYYFSNNSRREMIMKSFFEHNL